jgi:hypothetical protein
MLQVIQSRRSSPVKEEDVLQQFCDARYQNVYNGRQMTEEEITGLLIAVLFAGQHTSSITSSWTGYFMIKDKVRQQHMVLGVAVDKPCTCLGVLPGSCFSQLTWRHWRFQATCLRVMDNTVCPVQGTTLAYYNSARNLPCKPLKLLSLCRCGMPCRVVLCCAGEVVCRSC